MAERMVCGIMYDPDGASGQYWTTVTIGDTTLVYLQGWKSFSLAIQNLPFDYIAWVRQETHSVHHTKKITEPQ